MNKSLTSRIVALVCLGLFTLQSFAGTVTGQVQNAAAGPVRNGTFSFTLTAPATVAGTATVVTSSVPCYTDGNGNVAGEPDPLLAPVLSVNLGSGTLAAATYFVKIWYFDGTGNSFVSPEASVSLVSPGTLNVLSPVKQPLNAGGFRVGISTASGTETLQGSVTGVPGAWGNFSQSAALVAGTAMPASNTTVCTLRFNDELTPSFTCYDVGLTSSTGANIPGFPQYWSLAGGSAGTINVGSGTPQSNVCQGQGVVYPQAIVTLPPFNATQTVNGGLNVTGNVTVGGTLGVTGAVTFGGGVPWYDVTFFGAKCDGVTDDTTTTQAAIAAAALLGDNVALPDGKTCIIATNTSPALNLDLMRHTAIISGVPSGRSRPGGGIDHISTLKFTGTPAIALSARGSFGVALNGVAIQATNAAFTGTLIDVSHLSTDTGCGGSPCDSQNFFLLNSTASGVGSGCTIGLSLDKAIKFTVENSNFFGCVSLLKGASASGSYSNVGTIKHNEFSASAGVTGFIVNPGESWAVSNNTFETNAASVNTLGNSGGFADTTALEFSSNWDGDDAGAGAYTKYVLPANTVAHFSGNTITATHNNVTGVSIGNNSEVTFEDNNFNGGSIFGTLFSLGTGDILHVGPQQYGTVSAFLSGTPASGSDVVDNTGKKTEYGTVGFTGQIQSTIATGTAPLTVTSTTPVATLTVSNHPQIRSCQGATPCANASTTGQLLTYDGGANYTLSGGTLTVTGFPYALSNSFGCWAWDTTNAANKVIPTNNSGASVTFTGTTTDTFKFLCIGA